MYQMIMSTKFSNSSIVSSCYFNSNVSRRSSKHQDFMYKFPSTNCSKKIDESFNFLKISSRHGILNHDMDISMSSSKIQPKAASGTPPNNPSSPWKSWLLAIFFTVIIPAVGHKGGLWTALKERINKTVEVVEHVAEVLEEVAEQAEKLVEEVEEKLPGDSKLKEALESFDNLAKSAVKEAKIAEDLVHKVKKRRGKDRRNDCKRSQRSRSTEDIAP